jgi:hypothetical protein
MSADAVDPRLLFHRAHFAGERDHAVFRVDIDSTGLHHIVSRQPALH